MKKLFTISSILAIGAGSLFIIGGIWGIVFTYKNIAQEKIITPTDAAIPGKPVSGPRTLKAQADIIREHTLKITDGKTYAEMPRQVPKLDENGQPVVDADGKSIMTTNTARDIWITSTTLTTALNLGILTYVFSGLILLLGGISIWTGIVFGIVSRNNKNK